MLNLCAEVVGRLAGSGFFYIYPTLSGQVFREFFNEGLEVGLGRGQDFSPEHAALPDARALRPDYQLP